MTYDPNIPQDLPSPSVIVDKIRLNFSQYADVFDNNHSPLNNSNQGKHTNVILQEQIMDPEVVGGFDSLYGKSVTATSSISDQVFVRIPKFLPDNKPNNPMQLTCSTVKTSAQFQTFIAGGYLVYFDTIPSANAINTIVSLSPAPSEILCVIPNPTKLVFIPSAPTVKFPTPIAVTIIDNFRFRIEAPFPNSAQQTGNINWIAIARQ